jgi:hypothetical protein
MFRKSTLSATPLLQTAPGTVTTADSDLAVPGCWSALPRRAARRSAAGRSHGRQYRSLNGGFRGMGASRPGNNDGGRILPARIFATSRTATLPTRRDIPSLQCRARRRGSRRAGGQRVTSERAAKHVATEDPRGGAGARCVPRARQDQEGINTWEIIDLRLPAAPGRGARCTVLVRWCGAGEGDAARDASRCTSPGLPSIRGARNPPSSPPPPPQRLTWRLHETNLLLLLDP